MAFMDWLLFSERCNGCHSDQSRLFDKLGNPEITFNNPLKIRNIQDLETFVATAERGSLSSAARLLELSPAVASASLKRLEADLGVALFIRSTRSMRLTLAGERLSRAARLYWTACARRKTRCVPARMRSKASCRSRCRPTSAATWCCPG
jgi:molybdenum-dependent DNA-binding transcriptional regulator ModE